MKGSQSYILDLRNVKCPMNLVLVKEALFENKLQNGGKIIVEDVVARRNILAFLKAKNIGYVEINEGIVVL
jgi:TusA-related sulfurtransferase